MVRQPLNNDVLAAAVRHRWSRLVGRCGADRRRRQVLSVRLRFLRALRGGGCAQCADCSVPRERHRVHGQGPRSTGADDARGPVPQGDAALLEECTKDGDGSILTYEELRSCLEKDEVSAYL